MANGLANTWHPASVITGAYTNAADEVLTTRLPLQYKRSVA